MKTVFSKKVRSARRLKAFSQQKLADEIGVSKNMISKYEKGESIPSSPVLIKLANVLQLSPDFFFTHSAIELNTIRFRKKSKLPIKRLNSIKEEVKLLVSNYLEIENILQIDTDFDTSDQTVTIDREADIEKIVLNLREKWQIGIDPVHNITQLLEDQKIKVIEIMEEENLFDGMAALIDKKYAVIIINKNFPIERKRFTLLHELGHLILDIPECDGKEEEKLYNRFAAEFLFPKSSVLKEFGIRRSSISVSELIEVQQKYGISIPAIIYRLNELGIISSNHQERFYKQMNFDKGLKELINQERFETPEFSHRFEQLVYRAYSEEFISGSKAAKLLGKNINEVLAKEMV